MDDAHIYTMKGNILRRILKQWWLGLCSLELEKLYQLPHRNGFTSYFWIGLIPRPKVFVLDSGWSSMMCMMCRFCFEYATSDWRGYLIWFDCIYVLNMMQLKQPLPSSVIFECNRFNPTELTKSLQVFMADNYGPSAPTSYKQGQLTPLGVK